MVDYIGLLREEVVPAQGCTEPVAVAYAAAVAAAELDGAVTAIDLRLSANIIKNALGVGIPGTGSVGIEIAAALGAVVRAPERKLEVLAGLIDRQLECARALVAADAISIEQAKKCDALYIDARITTESGHARAVISGGHTNVVLLEVNGQTKFDNVHTVGENSDGASHGTGLTVEGIYDFVTTVPFEQIAFILDCVDINRRMSDEGLRGDYGLGVGARVSKATCAQTALMGDSAHRLISVTAAASDARMAGCPLPVMTCGGSGNQGLASSLPVIELAQMVDASKEQLARALVLSDLVTLHVKEYMGRLSPLCGSGIAGGAGASCGITYLQGGSLKEIKAAVNNVLGTLQGMICDGAKSTCALKIAAGTSAAIQGSVLALAGVSAAGSDGIVFDDAEETIRGTGRLMREGLSQTDDAILSIMLDKKSCC